MKKLMAAALLLLSMNAMANTEYDYVVSGDDSFGRSLDGVIYAEKGNSEVWGEMTDEKGNVFSFDGEWEGKGHVSGALGDGALLELDVD